MQYSSEGSIDRMDERAPLLIESDEDLEFVGGSVIAGILRCFGCLRIRGIPVLEAPEHAFQAVKTMPILDRTALQLPYEVSRNISGNQQLDNSLLSHSKAQPVVSTGRSSEAKQQNIPAEEPSKSSLLPQSVAKPIDFPGTSSGKQKGIAQQPEWTDVETKASAGYHKTTSLVVQTLLRISGSDVSAYSDLRGISDKTSSRDVVRMQNRLFKVVTAAQQKAQRADLDHLLRLIDQDIMSRQTVLEWKERHHPSSTSSIKNMIDCYRGMQRILRQPKKRSLPVEPSRSTKPSLPRNDSPTRKSKQKITFRPGISETTWKTFDQDTSEYKYATNRFQAQLFKAAEPYHAGKVPPQDWHVLADGKAGITKIDMGLFQRLAALVCSNYDGIAQSSLMARLEKAIEKRQQVLQFFAKRNVRPESHDNHEHFIEYLQKLKKKLLGQ